MNEANMKLWTDEFNKQLKDKRPYQSIFYVPSKPDLEIETEKHKYFAFRVEDIKEAEADKEILKSRVSSGVRGLMSAMKSDFIKLIHEELSTDDLLTHIDNKALVWFISQPLRMQCAYDLDHMSTSFVGDLKYTIGVIDKETSK